MTGFRTELPIDRLGERGEGIGRGPEGPVHMPYALPGETILAEVAGDRGRLIEIRAPSPDRLSAFCPHYGICGGCALQTLAPVPYAEWKRGMLVEALRRAGLVPEVAPLVNAHGEGRRRAVFHARLDGERLRLGFMRARAHDVVDLDACPILAPQMGGALAGARAVAAVLHPARKPLDLLVTASRSGLDIDIKGHGPLAPAEIQVLVAAAERQDLARLSSDGLCLIERRAPVLKIGRTEVVPPPGAFLQATEAGEEILAAKVSENLAGARRIADLFAGIGTFSLRLAERAHVHAVDADEAALAALARAARAAPDLRPVTVEPRDLFRRPLAKDEFARFDAVVFDPPRAGAEGQARALAASAVPVVVAVSCNAQTFARDAALLAAGGYRIARVMPFDQFRYSPHVESVAIFRRGAGKRRKPLLG